MYNAIYNTWSISESSIYQQFSLSLSLQTATAIVLPISTTVFLGKLRFYGKTNQVVQTKSSRGHLTKQKKNSPKQEKIKQKLANHVHVPESDQMPSHL